MLLGSGNGYYVGGDDEYRVAKGDLFLINYDMTHAFYRGDGDGELVTFNILFTSLAFSMTAYCRSTISRA